MVAPTEFRLFKDGRTQFAPTGNAPMVSKKKVAKEFRLFKSGRTQFAPTVNAPMVSKKKVAKENRLFKDGLWKLFKIKNKEKGDFFYETV